MRSVLLVMAGLVLLFRFAGCGQTTKVTPPTTEITHETITTAPDGTVTAEKAGARSIGAGLTAASPDGQIAGQFKSDAAELSLPNGGSAKGAAFDTDFKVTGRARTGLLVLAGFLAVLAAGCLYLGIRSVAIGLGAAAALAAAAYVYAWVLLGIPLVLAVAAVWAGWKWIGDHEGLRAVAAGVAGAPSDVAEVVKAEIAKHADARDRRTINRVKEADGL